ncbi:hypothetical protein AAFC00_004410 [Neodothiora populina]|uniref:Uncharacterized protein n=1 Tax=Neodothiora populina TaxID=2781224 RepID=A0ABR3PPX2_9PEZI
MVRDKTPSGEVEACNHDFNRAATLPTERHFSGGAQIEGSLGYHRSCESDIWGSELDHKLISTSAQQIYQLDDESLVFSGCLLADERPKGNHRLSCQSDIDNGSSVECFSEASLTSSECPSLYLTPPSPTWASQGDSAYMQPIPTTKWQQGNEVSDHERISSAIYDARELQDNLCIDKHTIMRDTAPHYVQSADSVGLDGRMLPLRSATTGISATTPGQSSPSTTRHNLADATNYFYAVLHQRRSRENIQSWMEAGFSYLSSQHSGRG